MKGVTLRIIILSVTFCLGVGPIHLFGYKETLQEDNTLQAATKEVENSHNFSPYTGFVILIYLNNAANFFIYSLIGRGFRKDLMKLFPRRCFKIKSRDKQMGHSFSGVNSTTVPPRHELTNV